MTKQGLPSLKEPSKLSIMHLKKMISGQHSIFTGETIDRMTSTKDAETKSVTSEKIFNGTSGLRMKNPL